MGYQIIRGKWNDNTYGIVKAIGRGGTARVYKVIDYKDGSIKAIKISEDIHSISKEKDMLMKFNNIGIFPKLYEVDDYIMQGKILYFIVIEFIDGCNLERYKRDNSIGVKEGLSLGILIGNVLDKLHNQGYIYGDLKLENIMYDTKKKEIRLIDLGGVVAIGKPVLEFTPTYDRAKWNMGKRLADEEYDMFALSMLVINVIIPKGVGKLGSINDVLKTLKREKVDYRVIRILEKGIKQDGITFKEMVDSLMHIKKTDLWCAVITYGALDGFINLVLSTSIIGFIIVTILNLT